MLILLVLALCAFKDTNVHRCCGIAGATFDFCSTLILVRIDIEELSLAWSYLMLGLREVICGLICVKEAKAV